MWLRELKRYFRSKSRMIGSLGQPLLFLLALGYGWVRVPGGRPGKLFPVPRSGHRRHEHHLHRDLFRHPAYLGPAVRILERDARRAGSRLNIMIGRTLGGATVATFQGIIVFYTPMLFGFRPNNWWLVPVAIVFMLLVALLFTALGTGIASLLEDMQGFQLS